MINQVERFLSIAGSFLDEKPAAGETPKNDLAILILRVACCFCFWGWAWQHIVWDAPYRELLWSQERMEGIVGLFGLSWQEYVGNPNNDQIIIYGIKTIGVFYIVFGLAALTAQPNRWLHKILLGLGALALTLLGYIFYLDRLRHVAQFFEFSLQIATPLLLILALHSQSTQRIRILLAKLTIAATFTAHGLYAFGAYPEIPGHFLTMTMTILPLSEPQAVQFLYVAGVLDFIVAMLIFLPYKPMVKVSLIYAALWGLATALARTWAGVSFTFDYWGLNQFLHLTFYRMPHALIPLYLYFVLFRAHQHSTAREPSASLAKDSLESSERDLAVS